MRFFRFIALIPFFLGFFQACVPKTQFDDQQAKLIEAQTKLRSLEASTAECDKDLFLQLKEQAQSLDLLTQELVERNTELSKEVARLKVLESQTKAQDESCDRKLSTQATECDSKVERTRNTYEDLLRELKAEIVKLKDVADKAAGMKAKPKSAQKKENPKPAK